jgi:hypothetical protein
MNATQTLKAQDLGGPEPAAADKSLKPSSKITILQLQRGFCIGRECAMWNPKTSKWERQPFQRLSTYYKSEELAQDYLKLLLYFHNNDWEAMTAFVERTVNIYFAEWRVFFVNLDQSRDYGLVMAEDPEQAALELKNALKRTTEAMKDIRIAGEPEKVVAEAGPKIVSEKLNMI